MDAGATIRAGRYVVVGALGTGAQAETLDCVDKLRGTAVAIKRFSVRGAQSWKDVELAEREARVLASLDHPALPKYIEHFEEDGALYLVMERIEGSSLAAIRTEKQGRSAMGEREVLRLLVELGDVFEYLHGRAPAVIHRDVKPGNILRRPDGSFALVDFGAVRDKLKPQGGSTVVGTFGYMAPEQFQGRALPSSDVYALGATALAMLTGRDPEDLPHKGLAIDVDAALADTRDRSDLSRALTRALKLMVEPDPDKRPASVKSVLDRAAVNAAASGAARDDRGGGASRHGAAPHARVRVIDPRAIFEELAPPGPGASRREWRAWKRTVKERARQLHDDRRQAAIAARRAAKAARRQWRQDHGFRPTFVPRPILALLSFGLLVAQIAVMFALTIVTPTVLMLLSLVFGRPLSRAAHAVRALGTETRAALGVARSKLTTEGLDAFDAIDPDKLVEDFDARLEPRVRVAEAEADDRARREEEAAIEEAAEEEEARRRVGR